MINEIIKEYHRALWCEFTKPYEGRTSFWGVIGYMMLAPITWGVFFGCYLVYWIERKMKI